MTTPTIIHSAAYATPCSVEPPADVEHHAVVEHVAAELEEGEQDAELDARLNAGTRGVHAREDRWQPRLSR